MFGTSTVRLWSKREEAPCLLSWRLRQGLEVLLELHAAFLGLCAQALHQGVLLVLVGLVVGLDLLLVVLVVVLALRVNLGLVFLEVLLALLGLCRGELRIGLELGRLLPLVLLAVRLLLAQPLQRLLDLFLRGLSGLRHCLSDHLWPPLV